MHSLHCAEVVRTLRQVSVSDVPYSQKVWAPDVYATAVTKLKSLNERGLRLADIIDSYAQAWNTFVQHGDEHGLRGPLFSKIVETIVNANEKLITDIRKEVILSIKENGQTITRHSANPGKECKLRCALVIPESRETRQIREQVLGWTMKDYCYHHPLKSPLSKLSLQWRQLEYAASLLKLLLLAQIHAEHTYCGIALDVKAERQKQLEAIQDLTEKRQQLSFKEAKENDTSLHYGNPIGVLNVSNLHPLPLSITVSRWFRPQRATTPTVESSRAVEEVQQIIQQATGGSAEQIGLVMNESNALRAQYAELMKRTNDLVLRLSGQDNTTNREVTSGTATLADAIHSYVFSNASKSHSMNSANLLDVVHRTPDSPDVAPELGGVGKQEIGGSSRYPFEKTIDTPDASRRSSIWGLEDACVAQEEFNLTELEQHRRRPSNSDTAHMQNELQKPGTDKPSSSPSEQVDDDYEAPPAQQRVRKNIDKESDKLPIYELADNQVLSQSFGILIDKFELSPIGSLFTENMWISETLLIDDPLSTPT